MKEKWRNRFMLGQITADVNVTEAFKQLFNMECTKIEPFKADGALLYAISFIDIEDKQKLEKVGILTLGEYLEILIQGYYLLNAINIDDVRVQKVNGELKYFATYNLSKNVCRGRK